MIRRIIEIDEEKCNGCGACASACMEGAIEMVGGKAKLMRDDYCDGLGNCLPACPTGAISFIEREAAAFDEEAVKNNLNKKQNESACGCPGTNSKQISREADSSCCEKAPSRLSQWPVQLKLVPVNAPYFHEADLLIAADCTAYAYGNFHNDFIRDKITVVGCPKLDDTDYSEKLTQILKVNDIKSITIVRMEVPCCGGIERFAKTAIQNSGKSIPHRVVTISVNGDII